MQTVRRDKARIRTARDAETAKTERKVLVAISIFEMILGPNETIGPEETRVIGGHSLGPIDDVSALDTVKDTGVLAAYRSVVLRGRVTRMGWSRVGDAKLEHRHHARIDTVDTVEKHIVGIGYERIDFLQLVHTREKRRKVLVKIRI